jgi:hypothetical protein
MSTTDGGARGRSAKCRSPRASDEGAPPLCCMTQGARRLGAGRIDGHISSSRRLACLHRGCSLCSSPSALTNYISIYMYRLTSTLGEGKCILVHHGDAIMHHATVFCCLLFIDMYIKPTFVIFLSFFLGGFGGAYGFFGSWGRKIQLFKK